MKRFILCVSIAFCAAATRAQDTALIRDTTVRPDDSPLVAAAKRAVAARRSGAPQSVWQITDSMVGHALAVSAPSPALPPAAPRVSQAQMPSTFSSYDARPGQQAAEAKRRSLQREQQQMAEEHDQPYGGDISEDRVVQRLSQIPTEINATKPPN